jgi:hypothetical protein
MAAMGSLWGWRDRQGRTGVAGSLRKTGRSSYESVLIRTRKVYAETLNDQVLAGQAYYA